MPPVDSNRDEELRAWIDRTLRSAIDDLMDAGVATSLLVEAKPVWVLPFQILIGKIREHGDSRGFSWVIAGDLPTDHADSSLAQSPREAARYFALRWQLDAARDDATPGDLVGKAESLYGLVEDDWIWSAGELS